MKQMAEIEFNHEINGRIYFQVIHLLQEYMDTETNGRYIKIILDTMIKLQAMGYHLNNYINIDQHFTEHVKQSYIENPHEIKNAHILLYELEAFLFQLKSSLDIMIKAMDVLFPGHFKTHTFQGKGDKLIKNLENYKKNKKAKPEIIDDMISMIKDDKNSWIEDSVTLRNTLSHYKTFTLYSYKVEKINGSLAVVKPKILELNPLQFMKTTFSNCIEFIQDLLALSIALYLPPIFGLAKPSIPEAWKELEEAQYIKYSIGIIKDV